MMAAYTITPLDEKWCLYITFLGSKRVPRSLHIVTQRESLPRLNRDSLLNNTLVVSPTLHRWRFKLPFKQGRFCQTWGEWKLLVFWHTGQHDWVSWNSFSRNSYSCGNCERQTQFSGSTIPLTSRTYWKISVLVKGYDTSRRGTSPVHWNICHSL